MTEGIGSQIRRIYEKAKANKAAGCYRVEDDVVIAMMEVIIEQRKEVCNYYREKDIMLSKFKRIMENVERIESNLCQIIQKQSEQINSNKP